MSLVAAWEFIRPEGTMEMAHEQVREAGLRAHGGRQHAQRQIKRARRRLEQILQIHYFT
jgi:hypothetical protein